MRVSGFALLVLGILALVYGGISYNRQRTVVDLGPIHATATEHKNVPVSPVVGGIAVVAGILLLAIPRKSLTAAA
jgi:hypothetical protein